MKIALITGINGMDGSHLADYLLELGYEVHGIVRRTSTSNLERIFHILDKITLHDGDLTDQSSLNRIMAKVNPAEVYNLAAQSFVGVSWNQPSMTGDVTGLGAVRVYEAARQLLDAYGEAPRIYQASTSEMFGDAVDDRGQDEETVFTPKSPYGAAKLYAHNMARIYRDSFGMFIACGILFNHEGPRRGEQFVTRKITKGVADIVLGVKQVIKLGNLDSARDWGYAGDYVKAMHAMLQKDEPDDFVIGTGTTRTIREFLTTAFNAAGISGWSRHVEIDERFMRPNDVHTLRADPMKAGLELGWRAETPFEDWVKNMVHSDMNMHEPFVVKKD